MYYHPNSVFLSSWYSSTFCLILNKSDLTSKVNSSKSEIFDLTFSIHYKFHLDMFDDKNMIASDGLVKSISYPLLSTRSK